MNILVDTHIFLWLLFDVKKIKKEHLSILEDINSLFISYIRITEIMIKKSVGKLNVDFDLEYVLDMFDMQVLNFGSESALKLFQLPLYHRVPFDRMIIAQIIINNYIILSYDENFKKYNCKLMKYY